VKYVTVAEYASEYCVSPQYVRRLIRNGKIKAVRIHERLWLIENPEQLSVDERLEERNLILHVRKKAKE
jgi:hypothetical protein